MRLDCATVGLRSEQRPESLLGGLLLGDNTPPAKRQCLQIGVKGVQPLPSASGPQRSIGARRRSAWTATRSIKAGRHSTRRGAECEPSHRGPRHRRPLLPPPPPPAPPASPPPAPLGSPAPFSPPPCRTIATGRAAAVLSLQDSCRGRRRAEELMKDEIKEDEGQRVGRSNYMRGVTWVSTSTTGAR